MQWFGICLYCEMVSTVCLVIIITIHNYKAFILWWERLKVYCLSHFQVHNSITNYSHMYAVHHRTWLFDNCKCIPSDLLHAFPVYITASVSLLTSSMHFPMAHLPSPASGRHQSAVCAQTGIVKRAEPESDSSLPLCAHTEPAGNTGHIFLVEGRGQGAVWMVWWNPTHHHTPQGEEEAKGIADPKLLCVDAGPTRWPSWPGWTEKFSLVKPFRHSVIYSNKYLRAMTSNLRNSLRCVFWNSGLFQIPEG